MGEERGAWGGGRIRVGPKRDIVDLLVRVLYFIPIIFM
jgi:hypothetical protein